MTHPKSEALLPCPFADCPPGELVQYVRDAAPWVRCHICGADLPRERWQSRTENPATWARGRLEGIRNARDWVACNEGIGSAQEAADAIETLCVGMPPRTPPAPVAADYDNSFDRLQDIIDDGFGPQPTMTASALMTFLERKLREDRVADEDTIQPPAPVASDALIEEAAKALATVVDKSDGGRGRSYSWGDISEGVKKVFRAEARAAHAIIAPAARADGYRAGLEEGRSFIADRAEARAEGFREGYAKGRAHDR